MAGEAGELAVGGGVPAAVCGAGDRGLVAGGVTVASPQVVGGVIVGVLGGAVAGRAACAGILLAGGLASSSWTWCAGLGLCQNLLRFFLFLRVICPVPLILTAYWSCC